MWRATGRTILRRVRRVPAGQVAIPFGVREGPAHGDAPMPASHRPVLSVSDPLDVSVSVVAGACDGFAVQSEAPRSQAVSLRLLQEFVSEIDELCEELSEEILQSPESPLPEGPISSIASSEAPSSKRSFLGSVVAFGCSVIRRALRWAPRYVAIPVFGAALASIGMTDSELSQGLVQSSTKLSVQATCPSRAV